MATLTADQIAGYAKAAGFPDDQLRTAVGVALAESSGRTDAYNGQGRDDSYGLWQINMKGTLGPDRRAKFGITDNKQLFDPATNAKAAYIIWRGSGWNAWSTYKNKQYATAIRGVLGTNPLNPLNPLKYLPDDKLGGGASAAVDPVIGAAGGIKAGLNGITSGIDAFGKNIVKTAWNMGAVIVGVLLLITAFILYFKETPVTMVKKVVK